MLGVLPLTSFAFRGDLPIDSIYLNSKLFSSVIIGSEVIFMLTCAQLKNKKNTRYLLSLLIGLIILALFLFGGKPKLTQMIFYRAYRFCNLYYQNIKLRDWEELRGDFFTVKYKQEDKAVGEIVLRQAEEFYEALLEEYRVSNLPIPITIVVYPSSEELSSSFGWPAQERALGAYYAGSIRLLSPRAAYQGARNLEELEVLYRAYGPFIHEFTHLIIDYKAHGNYPRWFTEGLAQYEEYRLTNLIWSEKGERWYSLGELDGRHFDEIEDQSGVYWQSLQMVKDLMENYFEADGDNGLELFLTELASGKTFEQVFAEQFGLDLEVWTQRLKGQLF
ncbi:MAG TPA: hypothetical protein GXX38_04155 [Clostridia bacterium]|jgi:hypothetical protein|nr:hypothetical protein [Clostridia bacterium]